MRIIKYLIVVYLSFNDLFSDENNTTLPSIKKISQNLYNFGDIIIKRDEKSFSLPAVSNQISGLLNTGIVHKLMGKFMNLYSNCDQTTDFSRFFATFKSKT